MTENDLQDEAAHLAEEARLKQLMPLEPDTLRYMIIDLQNALQQERKNSAGKWAVHILGPDDVIDCDNELSALREANKLNKALIQAMQDHHPDDPFIVAIAENLAESV